MCAAPYHCERGGERVRISLSLSLSECFVSGKEAYLRVHVDVLEPKVRRKVHDLLRLREARDDLLCRPVRKAAKHRIDLIPFYVLYLGQRQVHCRVLGLALEEGLPEVREGGPEGLARAPLARDCPDVNTRVEGQKPCDLGPGVPARAKDSDLGLLGGGRHPHPPREDRLARPKVALPRRSATSAAAQPWPRRERHRATKKVAPYLIPRPAGGKVGLCRTGPRQRDRERYIKNGWLTGACRRRARGTLRRPIRSPLPP